MTRTISIILALTFLLVSLSGCGETAFTVDSSIVSSVAVAKGSTASLVIDTADEVLTVMNAVEQAGLKTDSTAADTLPEEQYRLTLYRADQTAVMTLSIFSESYLQADTTLYKGNLSLLLDVLGSYFKVDSMEDLSAVFTLDAKDIAEIAFHHVTDGTYKVAVDKTECATIYNALKELVPGKAVEIDAASEFRFYIRAVNETAYRAPIIIQVAEENTVVSCGGKITSVSSYDWDALYQSLPYNLMPIPQ